MGRCSEEDRALSDPNSLAAPGPERDNDQAVSLPARIARYSRARDRAVQMADYLRDYVGAAAQNPLAIEKARKAGALLRDCGNYLHFRHYFTVGEIRLHAASFCKQHLICPLCAIRRGSKTLTAYLARFHLIQVQRPELRAYLVTATVKDGWDLRERFNHLRKSLKTLQDRRRRWLAGTRGAPWTEFAKVEGAVGSIEVKLGKGGHGWHPHAHMIVLAASAPDQAALRAEWEGITGDSFMVDVRPLREGSDPAEAFMEVMKYALKFSGMDPQDNWHAAGILAGKRLLFSLGCFRGVEVPDVLTDEPLEDLPYFDLFYRYFHGSGYSLTGELPAESFRMRNG